MQTSRFHHLAALALVVLVPACGAENETGSARHSLDEVPKAARAALDAQARGAEITRVERETERGVDVYEGTWTADGRTYEAKVSADGRLIEREEAIAAEEAPEQVRAEIARRFPSASDISYVRKIFYVSGESINYEVELRVDGKRHEVLLSATGQDVQDPTDEGEDESEDGDEDDDDDDDDGDD